MTDPGEQAQPSVSSVVRWRVIISGRVQGVGFRSSCARRARKAALSGQVRNLDDGRVEAIFQGPVEAVERLTRWCRSGPLLARVRSVEIIKEEPSTSCEFVAIE
jgi:acylphosphatase